MIQTPKKNLKSEIQEEYFINRISKVVLQLVKQLKWFTTNFKESIVKKVHYYQKVDGIAFWKIDWKLNRLAVNGIPEETLKNGKIIISLPHKQSLGYASPYEKKFIEQTVNELEGFNNLRLSQFHSYTPRYIETRNGYDILRWIEIEIEIVE